MDVPDVQPSFQQLPCTQSLVEWYGESSSLCGTSVAREAFEGAKSFFFAQLSKDEYDILSVNDRSSFEDIQLIVDAERLKYEQFPKKGKVKKWLRKLSARVMYYGTILDTLAQHHPEYVALAWGALKVVFVGILNHEELVERIAEALSNIADALPWTKLSLRLYPTHRMKEIASQLYAYIIKFFQQAVTWYKKSTFSRGLSGLLKPYELEYKTTVVRIQYYTKAIENASTSASRAELRDMHVKLNSLTKKFDELLQLALRAQAINHSIDQNVGEQKKMIYDLQLSQILALVASEQHPQDKLLLCRSILARRSRVRPELMEHCKQTYDKLKDWAACPHSSLLLIQPGPGSKAKAQGLATTTIEILQEKTKHVLWALSTGGQSGEPPNAVMLLKDLVSQALQLASTGLYRSPGSLSAASFHVAHSLDEWLELLCMILSSNEETFIVIESDDLFDTVWRNTKHAEDFIGIFRRIVERVDWTPKVKILIVNYHPLAHNGMTEGPRAMELIVESQNTRRKAAAKIYGKARGTGRGRW